VVIIRAMVGSIEDAAYEMGVRLRADRHRLGLTQCDVATRSGVSPSTLSRMELGHGGDVPLRSWIAVSVVLGHDLIPATPNRTGAYVVALTRLVDLGGWTLGGRRREVVWFDRPPRPILGYRRLQAPAERAVLAIIETMTDLDVAYARLERDVDAVRTITPPGLEVAGALVVIRSTANRRRLSATVGRRSSAPWVTALSSPTTTMPDRSGLVWLAARGTNLLPGW
jgi:hypothetical protein